MIRASLVLVVVVALGGCKKPGEAPKGSVSCHIAVQDVCNEYPAPTAEDDANVAVVCSSGSGVLAHPAACPPANFVGKCTTGSGTSLHVERRYTGTDVKYAQDFCVNTAHGVWATTF